MITIVAMGATDADALATLHAQGIDPHWDAKAFRDLLAGSSVFALGVEPHAFILARVAAGEAEILTLVTVPNARRRGLARALVIAAAIEAARRNGAEIFLEVAADNGPALALYTGLGFVPVGRRAHYYVRPGAAPADALTLKAPLPLPVPMPYTVAPGRRGD